MKSPSFTLSIFVFTVAFSQLSGAAAQTSFANGQKVLKRLGQSSEEAEKFWQDHSETRLSVYLGRRRSGSIVLRSIFDKNQGLKFVDEFELNHENIGRTFIASEQSFDLQGHLIRAFVKTSAPKNTGKMLNTEYTIERKQGSFQWSKKDHKGKTTTKTLDKADLVFALPLGLTMRLPVLAQQFDQLSFNAVDMRTGISSRLKLQLGAKTEKLFRRSRVNLQSVQIDYNEKTWILELGPESKLLSLKSNKSSIFSIVGGLVSSERFEALPEPVEIQANDAKGVVILFFRGLALGEAKAIEPYLDVKALYSQALARRGKKDPEFKKIGPFKTLLFEKLLDYSWLAKHNLSVNSTSMRLDDLKMITKPSMTLITLPGGGQIMLRQVSQTASAKQQKSWKIVGFGGGDK